MKAETCGTRTGLWDGHSGLIVQGAAWSWAESQDCPFLNSLPIVKHLGAFTVLLIVATGATDMVKHAAFCLQLEFSPCDHFPGHRG